MEIQVGNVLPQVIAVKTSVLMEFVHVILKVVLVMIVILLPAQVEFALTVFALVMKVAVLAQMIAPAAQPFQMVFVPVAVVVVYQVMLHVPLVHNVVREPVPLLKEQHQAAVLVQLYHQDNIICKNRMCI